MYKRQCNGCDMDITLRLSDIVIVVATLLGPIFAVQAQKWLERRRETRERRLEIFRNLMATRAAFLSDRHVESLNAISIEFYNETDVIDAWKSYLDHLSQEFMPEDTWRQRRADLFTDLLWKLAKSLGYHYTRVEIQREVYSPKAHDALQQEQAVIRNGLYRLFNGETALPLDIKSVQSNPEIAAKQIEIQTELLNWLNGNRTVKVEFTAPKSH